MQFPLNQFEQYIDEVILQRGFSYFNNGHVNPPEELSNGTFEFVVEGSEDYTVEIDIKKDTVVNYNCNCQYDFGPVCKHIAAAIFYLQKDKLETLNSSKNKRKNKKRKTKTVSEQINELLDKTSHNDLKNFISEQCLNSPSFRHTFFSTFGYLSTNESIGFYGKQVKSILQSAKDRYDFIDWKAVRFVGSAVGDLLNTAQKYLDDKNYQSALFICCAVMEEMTEALQFADDSFGDVGGNIDLAYSLLNDIAAEENLPDEVRKILFEYCISSFNKGIFSGWDWHLGMLDLASRLFSSPKEANTIIELLDKYPHSEFEMQAAQLIKLDILTKTKGEKAANAFIEKNLSNSFIREIAIEKAIDNENYGRANEIAEEGIKYDKDKPGLVIDWYDWLLKVATTTNNKEKTLQYARLLFIESNGEKNKYYKILKNNVKKDNWNLFVENLINDLNKQSKWSNFYDVANIYIEEKWGDRLLGLLRDDCSLNNIANYETYLSEQYPSELADLYVKGIANEINNCSSRKQYKNLCRYIRRIKKLGEPVKAYNLIEKLRNEHPRKRALLEELDSI